jgi:hypothetical protein
MRLKFVADFERQGREQEIARGGLRYAGHRFSPALQGGSERLSAVCAQGDWQTMYQHITPETRLHIVGFCHLPD